MGRHRGESRVKLRFEPASNTGRAEYLEHSNNMEGSCKLDSGALVAMLLWVTELGTISEMQKLVWIIMDWAGRC